MKTPEFKIAATIAGVAAASYWGTLHPLLKLLFYLMFLDVVSGLIAGCLTKTISSAASLRGIAKKCMMLILVSTAEIVGASIGASMGSIQFLGAVVGLGTACAGGFCITEILSIIENGDRCGVKIPPYIRQVFIKLNQQVAGEGFDERQHDLNVQAVALEVDRSDAGGSHPNTSPNSSTGTVEGPAQTEAHTNRV